MSGKQLRFWRHLPLTLMLSMGLMLLSYIRIAGDSQTMAFRDGVVNAVFAGEIWGSTLSINLALFALAMIGLHLAYGVFCWIIGRLAQVAWPSPRTPAIQYVVASFLLLTIGLFANNSASFVRSSLGEHYAETMMQPIAGVSLGRWVALLVIAGTLLTCVVALGKMWRAGKRPSRPVWIGGAALALVYLGSMLWGMRSPPVAVTARPNVILIGIDSLRHDLVDPTSSPGVTPNLQAFLAEGVQFSNAMTPLARTFPSLTSILTGRHPHSTGAVVNLLPRDLIREGDTLGRIFKRAGYRTAYATDEVRFSNIDESYGFDRMVSPPIGASEFVISLAADTPLSNAVVNTTLGKWLFPHVHANRAAAVTYDPDTFIERIDDEIPFEQPLFLGVHFTLPHWPYVWADAPVMKESPIEHWPDYYLHVARRADQQLKDLLDVLERRGVLRNAIVVVYSDHGESFGTAGDSMVPMEDPLIVALFAKPQWGHGTSVLSAHQYRVVLGVRGYGNASFQSTAGRTIDAAVSTEDIAPTLVALAGAASEVRFDGRSLAPLLRGEKQAADAFAGRIRYTETEYQASNLASQDGKLSMSALKTASEVYRVDRSTDRIEVRRERLDGLLRDRQYAAIGETLLLAALPDVQGPLSHRFIVVEQASGVLTQIDGAPPADASAELLLLWTGLHTEFEGIIPAAGQSSASPVVADSPVANPARVLTTNVKN